MRDERRWEGINERQKFLSTDFPEYRGSLKYSLYGRLSGRLFQIFTDWEKIKERGAGINKLCVL